ncbi:MAG: 5'/3'-nucleotidase SurE, partial [Rhodospirillales bacterium]|nr:5'/3'-nucleotidase SurE [Rhodospirillales bacterium]
MRERVKSLRTARVLISNDDGINAPGLKMLERVMVKLAGEVWVVAPETEQSAASHSLTLRQPLRIR